MVHVVKARKQGYAHRYDFDRFVSRYGYLRDGVKASEQDIAPFLAK
jgi:myosin heavy subunit